MQMLTDLLLRAHIRGGSNMTIANNGMLYLMMEQLGTKMKQSNGVNLSNAQRQLSYLLGTNANSYCFVTGYGSLSPEHTHHRPSRHWEKL